MTLTACPFGYGSTAPANEPDRPTAEAAAAAEPPHAAAPAAAAGATAPAAADAATTPAATAPAAAAAEAPVVDFYDQAQMMRDPYPTYERMRALGPVVFAPKINRYLATTHAAVAAAEHDQETFSPDIEGAPMVRALGGKPMLRKNDPEHAVERTAINPTLRPKSIKNVWAPKFEATVSRWLDHLDDVGPESADLNRDYAAPVASQNLIDLIGFREVEVADMHRWSSDFIDGSGNLLDDEQIWARCDRSRAEVDAVLDELIPFLRRNPDPSMTSLMLEAGLDDQIVRANVKLTISGGMNEPQHMITNMVWALDGHRDQLEALLDDPTMWANAFEETVRWQSPIGMIPRQTTRDAVLLGTRVPAGFHVGLLTGSANRDAAVFDEPDRFDVRRQARGHVGFGQGVHQCAGRWAAKTAVGDIAVPAVFERFPSLRVDDSRETTWNGFVFRGITALPVTW